jgi:hypothetical protein
MPDLPRSPDEYAERTARAAGIVLQHDVAQQLPYKAVEILRAIERQDGDIHPDDASRFVLVALQAVVAAEIAAVREARP